MTQISYAADDHLARFIAKAQRFPMLSADEERTLVNRWREDDDQEALTQLLGSHLRLVIKFAFRNRGYGLPVADLIAEGNVGLMQAVERFDPERGYRFATYALWWIRAAIQEYVLRNWSLVRLGTTAAQKKLFFNLRRLKSSLDAYEEGELSPEVAGTIAAELDVSTDDVIEMNRRLASAETSLSTPAGEDGDTPIQDLLPDERPDQETVIGDAEEFRKRWALVKTALDGLAPRERRILAARWLDEDRRTLAELGEALGISRERVRQIEAKALGKLRKSVQASAGRRGLLSESGGESAAFKEAA